MSPAMAGAVVLCPRAVARCLRFVRRWVAPALLAAAFCAVLATPAEAAHKRTKATAHKKATKKAAKKSPKRVTARMASAASSGLVGAWSFDEASGNAIKDLS